MPGRCESLPRTVKTVAGSPKRKCLLTRRSVTQRLRVQCSTSPSPTAVHVVVDAYDTPLSWGPIGVAGTSWIDHLVRSIERPPDG
jgi:hypothetical protein